MKRSVKVRVVCLVLAVTVLGGAVTVAAIMGSPYETLRTAVLDALTMRNVTVEMDMDIKVNGETVYEVNLTHIQGDTRAFSVETIRSGEFHNNDGFNFSTPNLEMTPFRLSGSDLGANWYRAQVFSQDVNHSSFARSPFGIFSEEDRNSSEMRFAELLLDLVVGDLRNNISMTSENGIRRIRGSLSENQVPEIVRVGLDMFVERSLFGMVSTVTEFLNESGTEVLTERTFIDGQQRLTTTQITATPVRLIMDVDAVNMVFDSISADATNVNDRTVEISVFDNVASWRTFYINGNTFAATGPDRIISESERTLKSSDFEREYPLNIPMQNLVINHVVGEAEVDAAGNLLSINANGLFTATDIFDQVHEMEISITVRFSDIGTSDPSSPVSGAETILTMDNLRARFGNVGSRMSVFFTLNEDGSINEESITTTHPAEQAINRLAEDMTEETEGFEEYYEYSGGNSEEDMEDAGADIAEVEMDDDDIDAEGQE